MKPLNVLVMSVGPYERNGTAKYLKKIGAPEGSVTICLPNEKKENAESYRKQGFEVFIYDERKYIEDSDFEFFGFKRRNCGGVGRQGIYEACLLRTEKNTILQLDDDTAGIHITPKGKPSMTVNNWADFEKLFLALAKFQKNTGLRVGCRTGATVPTEEFMSSRKLFNNFILEGDEIEGRGFKALCSDDLRFQFIFQMRRATPFLSLNGCCISFTQSQGQRPDGNAVIYNSDYSWKKAAALMMLAPYCTKLHVAQEGDTKHKHYLFREFLKQSYFAPSIMLEDGGKFVAKLN